MRYLLGVLALLCLSYEFAAEILETNSGKSTNAENANFQTTKAESKVFAAKSSSGKATSSQGSDKQEADMDDPVKILSSGDSERREKSAKTAKTLNALEPTEEKGEEAGGFKEPTENESKTNGLYNSHINTNQATDDTFKPARILVILPLPFYSHTQNFMPIFKELARRGHYLTVVSPFPQNMSLPNWEEVLLPDIWDRMMAIVKDKDFSKGSGFLAKVLGEIKLAEYSNRLALELEQIRELYDDESRQFDLVMLEPQSFLQAPFLAFGHKFKAPVISLYPSYITPEVAYYTGNPVMTSTYVPNLFYPFSNSMSFVERAINTAFTVMRLLGYNLVTIPKMDALMREYFPSEDLPYVGDMLFNVSFTLIDSHHVLSYPYPRVNNIREFLGINTKPTSYLSEELQEYMDSANDGVLLFTLGSYFETSALRPHILNSLFTAFSRLPIKVMMKWNKDERPEGLGPNVRIEKWFPQSAILAHKNCVGFLTHTGAHSLVESMGHAVPVISLPLIMDQHFFSKWVVEHGVGRAIDCETVTPETAYETINEVITNKKYKENAIEISKLMRDLPQPTLSEVTYWIEYVIRTNGAPLLRPGTLNLAWYQMFGLDLLVAAMVIILALLWIVSSIVKCMVLMCNRSKTSTNKDTDTLEKNTKKQE